jgi:hypothetical protein
MKSMTIIDNNKYDNDNIRRGSSKGGPRGLTPQACISKNVILLKKNYKHKNKKKT